MAKIDIKEIAIDAASVVAGGEILSKYVVGNISFLGDLMAKIPAVGGIALGGIVTGGAALYAVRKFIMK